MIENNDELKKNITTFLLAEYSEMNDERKRQRDEGLKRLNFFITITSSVLGGLVIINGIGSTTSNQLHLIAIVALFFLLLVGWGTFRFSIDRDINTDNDIRSIARIRRYFVYLDPTIKEFITWRDNDEPTHYITGHNSTIRTTTHVLVSTLFAFVIGLSIDLIFWNLSISLLSGLIGFILAFFGLDKYIKSRFQKAHASTQELVRFPKMENIEVQEMKNIEVQADEESKKLDAS